MNKKPAFLSDSLLAHRPRKGEAKAQSEMQAALTSTTEAGFTTVWRRRRSARSPNTVQINIKVPPTIADRFIAIADRENLIFPDALALLIDVYEREEKHKI